MVVSGAAHFHPWEMEKPQVAPLQSIGPEFHVCVIVNRGMLCMICPSLNEHSPFNAESNSPDEAMGVGGLLKLVHASFLVSLIM